MFELKLEKMSGNLSSRGEGKRRHSRKVETSTCREIRTGRIECILGTHGGLRLVEHQVQEGDWRRQERRPGGQDTGSERGGHGQAVCEGAHSGSSVCGGVICNKARGSKASQEPFTLLEMVRPEYVRNGDTGTEFRDILESNQ